MDKVISGDPPWKEDAVSLPSGLQSLVEFFFLFKKWKTIFFCLYCHNPIFNHFILIIIIILFTEKDKKKW